MTKVWKRITLPIQIGCEFRISPVFIAVFSEMGQIIPIFCALLRKRPHPLFIKVERHSTDYLKNSLLQIRLRRMPKGMGEPFMIFWIVNLTQNPSNLVLYLAGSYGAVFFFGDM